MVVVDASAVLELLRGSAGGARLAARYVEPDVEFQAPHLIDAEVLSALRRWVLSGAIDPQAAHVRLSLYGDLVIRRHPHEHYLQRAFELRANLNAYDALYVALAEALDMPLVTADGRLARVTGHRAMIESL